MGKEETNSAAFEKLYSCAFDRLKRTKEILMESQDVETTKKRAIDCLDDHMAALKEIREKRFAASAPTFFSLAAPSSAATSAVSTPISNRGTTRELRRQMQQKNWEYIDEYRTEHGSNMDWERCFAQGKEKGLFQQYAKAKSVKAAYFRYKR
ncbi:hypothetical protein G6F56_007221 [Rhizopus delemar]|nr:hypothetical protein G6F56_007221 [Rhizopus delemar]